MSRWVRFLLVILIGIAIGLVYGWVIHPTEYMDTTPDTLRIDYKTDYVLMVAETFRIENDTAEAARRLGLLGSRSPFEITREAILFAERAGYTDADLALMRGLSTTMQNFQPVQETPTP